jgi:peptide/nickel transport system ATP-binding protein
MLAALTRTADPLLSVEDVSLVYKGGVRAVDRVSLTLSAGETLSLVGESGSGKSSLARLAMNLVAPTEGRILFEGASVGSFKGAALKGFRRHAQMIFQDPTASLSPRLTIRKLLAEPLEIHGLNGKQSWAEVLELLRRVNLPESVLDKYPHQISGGQARRVGIARALVLKPRLLVADEPTAGLDLSVQGEIMNLMGDLQRQFGLAYLIVSHNLSVVRAVSDRIAVMYLGRIVETGDATGIFARPAHPYTRALIAANPRIDPGRTHRREVLAGEIPSPRHPPSGCKFHTRCPLADAHCAAVEPQPRVLSDGRTILCHKPLLP